MRATVVQYADPTLAVAEGDQLLAQQHQPNGWAIGGEFGRQRGGNPIFPHELAHQGPRSDPGEQMALRLCRHAHLPLAAFLVLIVARVERERNPGYAMLIPDFIRATGATETSWTETTTS